MKLNRALTAAAIVATATAAMYGEVTYAQTPVTAAAPATPFEDIHPDQTQSIIRQADGTVLVLPAIVSDYKVFTPGQTEPTLYPKTALIYEKRNPLPPIQVMGGTYAFFKGDYLATTSADGFFTYKGKMNFTPDAIGGTFFTKKGTNELVVIDSYGYYVETGIAAPSIRLVGGNFFIDQDGVLTTIKSVGDAPGSKVGLVTRKEGWNFSDAVAAGGNFFLRQDGTIITVDSKTGFFSDHAFTPESRPSIMGGNYFIGQDNAIYTVSNDGKLFKTITLKTRPTVVGYSYMIFSDKSFAFVAANGGVHLEAVRVGAAGKAEHTTSISGELEARSTYVPNNYRRN